MTEFTPERIAEIEARCAAATEEWRVVDGHGGDYEVSNMGRVRSYLRPGNHAEKRNSTPRVMATGSRKGRSTVCLRSADGRFKTRKVAHLVAEAFHGPRPFGMECAHLNGDFSDDRAVNLAWVSHQENEAHKKAHGTAPVGERNGSSRLLEWQVAEIRFLLAKGVPQAKCAALFDTSKDVVSKIAAGQAWADVEARQDLEDLLSSYKERGEELERALAEVSGLRAAINWLEPPFVDALTSTDEIRKRIGFMLADVARVEARAQSKEPAS